MKRFLIVALVSLSALMAACGSDEPPGPTAIPTTAVLSPTVIMAAPTLTPGGPSLTPSSTLPPTVTLTNTPPPAPPTETPGPTDTPGPYEHVIQANEDCIGIAYGYGHNSLNVLSQIETLNNISCNSLPLGKTILIPRPTATPTAVGMDLTQTAVATSAPPMITVGAPVAASVKAYAIQEGDTLSSIAIVNDSSLRQICELNSGPNGIDCRGCTWESPNCCCPNPPVFSVGQEVFVPAPTATPTWTPTFTGSETPTFTPTHRVPQAVFPGNGASIAGPVRLTWMSVGTLADDEYYLVTVREETTGVVFGDETRQLSLDLPQEYLPGDGQARTFVWQVAVVQMGQDGLFYPTGPAMPEQNFIWRGWE